MGHLWALESDEGCRSRVDYHPQACSVKMATENGAKNLFKTFNQEVVDVKARLR